MATELTIKAAKVATTVDNSFAERLILNTYINTGIGIIVRLQKDTR